MDGAVEAGQTAARDVVDLLEEKSVGLLSVLPRL
jgi:hypothetical protein